MSTTPDDSDDLPRDKPPVEPPVMPTAEEAAATERPADLRPSSVRYAFVVWVLAGIFSMINGIVLLANKQNLVDQWTRTKAPNVSNEQIEQGATTLLWLFMVAAVVFAALFTLSAYKAQDGVRRARLILTMLCVVTVVFYFVVLPTPFGLMTALLALAATILLYLPKSNLFFRPGDLPT